MNIALPTHELAAVEANCRGSMEANWQGSYHAPHEKMFPELFLWDSAFHAIGMRHLDPPRAAGEISQIFVGQWADGGIRNIQAVNRGRQLARFAWQTGLLNRALVPDDVVTSGITQPPVLAESVWLTGQKLDSANRTDFWTQTVPKLALHHQWLYDSRDPNGDGLIEVVHPWESGMDNTPPILEHMKTLDWGLPRQILGSLSRSIAMLRKDTKRMDEAERSSTEEAILQTVALLSLMRQRYDPKRMADNHPLHITDIGFNSMLLRANTVLEQLAYEAGVGLSDELLEHMQRTQDNFGSLRDDDTGLYFSRDTDGHPIHIPTVTSLLPLYATSLTDNEVEPLVAQLADPETFGLPYGIPSVSATSPYYDEKRYWSGSVWDNMQWMIVQGLQQNNQHEAAEKIAHTMLSANSGLHEYYSARSGKGYGVSPFTWSASLRLDLIHSQQ